jgi:hypothetical protein
MAVLFLFDEDPEPVKVKPCPWCGRARYRLPDGTIGSPWNVIRFTFNWGGNEEGKCR